VATKCKVCLRWLGRFCSPILRTGRWEWVRVVRVGRVFIITRVVGVWRVVKDVGNMMWVMLEGREGYKDMTDCSGLLRVVAGYGELWRVMAGYAVATKCEAVLRRLGGFCSLILRTGRRECVYLRRGLLRLEWSQQTHAIGHTPQYASQRQQSLLHTTHACRSQVTRGGWFYVRP
jgi:hypothetical protein